MTLLPAHASHQNESREICQVCDSVMVGLDCRCQYLCTYKHFAKDMPSKSAWPEPSHVILKRAAHSVTSSAAMNQCQSRTRAQRTSSLSHCKPVWAFPPCCLTQKNDVEYVACSAVIYILKFQNAFASSHMQLLTWLVEQWVGRHKPKSSC